MVQNVVIVCDYGYIEGGAARIAHETALALARTGKHVVFFCAVGPVSDLLLQSSVEVVCLEQNDILHEKNRIKAVMRGIHNGVAKKAFTRILSSLSPENTVIHVHTWTKGISSSIFPVAEKMGFPVFLTVHDYFLVCPNGGLFDYPHVTICEKKPMSPSCIFCNCDARSYPQKVFRILRQVWQNKNIRRRKNIHYLFISKFSKEQFLRRYNGIPKEKQMFLTNMIHFPETRERVKCEENTTFLFMGGLTEVKGIRQFCEAVTRAGVPATVIGQGVLYDELKEKYPNISFEGWKKKAEMPPYLSQARCLVFPSIWYEGSPLTLREVMAYGIPVICSDKNAGSEQIEHGVTGWIYDGYDVDALVTQIIACKEMQDLQALSTTVFETFDVQQYGEETYLNTLNSIYNGTYPSST